MAGMSKPKILVVEDDENLRVALEDNLDDEGYDVVSARDGKSALKALAKDDFELCILDIMLPDVDGYHVCRKIREEGRPIRVLMLTARTLESDLVEGFDSGADDYLAKPYRLRELLARVRALLRRGAATDPGGEPASTQFAGFVLDLGARILRTTAGEEVKLTRTEFDLLACLLKNRGKALSREQILEQAWPEVVVDPRTVDNFVSSLKKKLGWTQESPYRIHTVRGVGYRMEVD
jgi:two-component system, OmpR family, phosphate regulon response regulator PhoB